MGYELDGRMLPSLEFDAVSKSCVSSGLGFGCGYGSDSGQPVYASLGN